MDRKKKCALLLLLRRYRKKKQRRFWVHPFITIMNPVGNYFLLKYKALKTDEKKFFEYFRMSIFSFEELLSLLSPYLQKQSYKGRIPVMPLEMIGLTIRFLATGNEIRNIHLDYYRGISTVAKIIRVVCNAIWKFCLNANIPKITQQLFEEIAADFNKKANFPNCIGAVDGKHIRVRSPPKSGSLFFNYKGYNSIVLLAIVDSKYRFIYVDIGAYGKESDSTIFHNTKLYDLLMRGDLPTPTSRPLPGFQEPVPFVFVGDEAFSISNNVMRPYSGKHLSVKQRVFNYRLSRARRYVECTFGILANKWRIFHRPINVSYDFAIDIVKACCILHNFVINRDELDTPIEMIIDNSELQPLQQGLNVGSQVVSANIIRNEYSDYFTSEVGALSWQLKLI
ncbi:uncharacterized protein LOC128199505 isoform X2 [Bicyclus anynana]|uniref:Protein ALP1-like n=2 Tax=Bicyclus anynana TaxID=110368 RepID=A0A6J1P342_BICAN|nr:uncharacterized protein LOC112050178 [Bicyclus anynana]XP_023951998.1 uncharacterized protein LOC112055935 [Bicyclus anynana]XP_052738960.1 uncharacterized protein LOC128198316 [Bicyclus anynana]XP_052743360.1 uncharacterized protein LOC128199160 [Bicyclus anynana]XP_052745250.1 uncharacterized protein LOC128199480 [Bicyclus anynana]XP_052745407.1 uncharacterized protein LOC128199505 isoform X2 [Bicyclus anynana]